MKKDKDRNVIAVDYQSSFLYKKYIFNGMCKYNKKIKHENYNNKLSISICQPPQKSIKQNTNLKQSNTDLVFWLQPNQVHSQMTNNQYDKY